MASACLELQYGVLPSSLCAFTKPMIHCVRGPGLDAEDGNVAATALVLAKQDVISARPARA